MNDISGLTSNLFLVEDPTLTMPESYYHKLSFAQWLSTINSVGNMLFVSH